MPRIAMLLFNNTSVGGTERRYAQVYEGLRRRNIPVSLAINESLLGRLLGAGLLRNSSPPDLVVKERIGRVTKHLFRADINARDRHPLVQRWRYMMRAVTFSLVKLDYALGCVSVGSWLLRRRPHVMHLVLGGAYVALPLQVLGCAPPALVSVVCPSLREMVGSAAGYRLYRVALRLATMVDALTESIRDALQGEGVGADRIRVSAGSLVNTDRFCPAPDKYPWVVFVGRLVKEKNPDLFVEACALVHARLPEARFFILGEGPLESSVATLIRRYGLECCTEMGWKAEVESTLKQAQVFVSLQRSDNYPSQALLEAMACGLSVVATDVGMTSKLVDETVGHRVEATAGAIAEAIVHLLENPSQAIARGTRARARVMERHSTEAYLDYLEGLYRGFHREGV